jgi:hypothetical protein
VTWVMSNLISVHLEIVLVSVQDRCTVCAKYTVGSEIILDTLDNTPRCTVCTKRTTGSEIVLDAPHGTPR